MRITDHILHATLIAARKVDIRDTSRCRGGTCRRSAKEAFAPRLMVVPVIDDSQVRNRIAIDAAESVAEAVGPAEFVARTEVDLCWRGVGSSFCWGYILCFHAFAKHVLPLYYSRISGWKSRSCRGGRTDTGRSQHPTIPFTTVQYVPIAQHP